MPRLNHYRFRSVWLLDASPQETYAALREVEDYPLWWQEVRSVRRLSDESAEIVCRASLPYVLRFVASRAVEDPEAGVLEASLRGDLDGFTRWTIGASAGGTRAVFDEEVEANKGLLRWLAPVARPAFIWNHTLMMRHGERGLRAHLAASRRQAAGPPAS